MKTTRKALQRLFRQPSLAPHADKHPQNFENLRGGHPFWAVVTPFLRGCLDVLLPLFARYGRHGDPKKTVVQRWCKIDEVCKDGPLPGAVM